MSSDEKISATARVQITLEIDNIGGNWGPECRVDQIHKQAREGAENRIIQLIEKERGIRIVGQPKVSAITFPLDR